MTSTVRLAVPSDEDQLVDLLQLRNEEEYPGFSFDADRSRQVVRQGIARHLSMVGVIRGPVRIEASVGLFVSGFWHSRDEALSDFWCYVHPEHRKSTHAKSLLEFSKWAAEQLGRPLFMSQMVCDATARKAQLYERQLGKAKGAIFLVTPHMTEAVAP